MDSNPIEPAPLSYPQSTHPLEHSPQTSKIFLFAESEIEKLKIMMPKHYSFVRKNTIEKIKNNLVLTPKQLKIMGSFRYYQKKVSSQQELMPLADELIVYPDFSEPILAKNDKPEIFAQVTSGYVTKLVREDSRPQKPKQEQKVQEKKPRLSLQQQIALLNRKRDEQVSKLTVTKVYPAGPLPKLNIKKYLEEQAKKRQKKKLEKEQYIQKQAERHQNLQMENKKKEQNNKKIQNLVPKTEREAVQYLISQFINNSRYVYLSEARTKPSMLFLEKMVLAKRAKTYPLDIFETDLRRIFKIYRNSSGQSHITLKEVSLFQEEMIKKLEKVKEKLGKKVNEKKQTLQIQSKQELSTTKPEKANVSSRGRIRKNLVMEFDVSQTQKKRSKMSRQVVKQYSLHNREVLGKNLLQMPTKYLQDFCLQFCSESQQKNRGNSSLFEFNLTETSPQRLYEMQEYVRQILASQSLAYKDLSDDEVSSDFIIEDED